MRRDQLTPRGTERIESYGLNMGFEPEYTIRRRFSFSASHVLDGLPVGHKCARLHGHTYQVEVALTGQIDGVGFVMDFAELDWVYELLREQLDHRHLNDVLPVNPTSENLAAWILRYVVGQPDGLAGEVSRATVTVAESPSTSASASALVSSTAA